MRCGAGASGVFRIFRDADGDRLAPKRGRSANRTTTCRRRRVAGKISARITFRPDGGAGARDCGGPARPCRVAPDESFVARRRRLRENGGRDRGDVAGGGIRRASRPHGADADPSRAALRRSLSLARAARGAGRAENGRAAGRNAAAVCRDGSISGERALAACWQWHSAIANF